jgi:predicted membrane protein
MFHDRRARRHERHRDHDFGGDAESNAGDDPSDGDRPRGPRGFGPGRRRGAFYPLVIGALIVTFGLTLLANNLGWTDMRSVTRQFWPFALVIFGVASLFNEKPGSNFWGLVLIVAGLWIYASQRDWIQVSFWAVFGPTVLILIGGTVVWRAMVHHEPKALSDDDPSGYINSFAVMSGNEHKPVTPFSGANVGAVMGAVKLDLTSADLKGDEVAVDVFVIMGGIEIYAPRDWEVRSKVVNLMGATVDKRRPAATPSGKVVVVRGFVLMGGLEIKD